MNDCDRSSDLRPPSPAADSDEVRAPIPTPAELVALNLRDARIMHGLLCRNLPEPRGRDEPGGVLAGIYTGSDGIAYFEPGRE